MARKASVVWAVEDTAAALHALWLLRQGQGPTAVAAAVGVGRNAVQRWLRWDRGGGLGAGGGRRRGRPRWVWAATPCSGGCAGTGRAVWTRCGAVGGAVRASPPI